MNGWGRPELPRRRGISEAEVDAATTRRLLEGPTGERCVICHEDMVEGEEVRRTRCGHQFHAKCADKWWTVGGWVGGCGALC